MQYFALQSTKRQQ